MIDFKCPNRLAGLLSAIGEKLTGEQLRECIQVAFESYRYGNKPTLTTAQVNAAEWVLGDDGIAELYVAQHRAGLEKLEELQRQCRYALERVTRRDYSIKNELQNICRNAADALKYIGELKDAAELSPLAETAEGVRKQ